MTWYARKPRALQKLGTIEGSGSTDIGYIAHVTGSPALGTAVLILASTPMTVGAKTITSGITDPDVPRALSVKGDTADISGNVVITGTNVANEIVTDTIALSGVSEVDGTVAFKTVTQIVFPGWNASGDEVSVGAIDEIGLYHVLTHDTVFRTFHDNSVEGTAPTVTTNAALEKNTALLNTALDGSAVDIYYVA